MDDFSLQGPLEQRNELGIMYRHAYSLTAVEKVNVPRKDASAFMFCVADPLEPLENSVWYHHVDPGLK